MAAQPQSLPSNPTPQVSSAQIPVPQPPAVPLINLKPRPARWHMPLSWMAGIAAVLIALSAGVYFFPKDRLEVGDQVAGETVHVKKLHLVSPGALVVKRVSVDEGIVPVAITQLLVPETYQEFYVPLMTGQAPLKPGERLYGLIYSDTNADGEINALEDQPKRNFIGRETRVYFSVYQ